LKEINTPTEFVTNPFHREYLTKLKSGETVSRNGNNSSSSSSDSKGATSLLSKRRLDFSSSSKNESFPSGLKSIKTEPSRKMRAWESLTFK